MNNKIVSAAISSTPEIFNEEPFNGQFFVLHERNKLLLLDTEGLLFINMTNIIQINYQGRNYFSTDERDWSYGPGTSYQAACSSMLNGQLYLIGDNRGGNQVNNHLQQLQ